MNWEKLEQSGVNCEEGLNRFSGNEQLYEKYLKKLLELTLYEEMKQAIMEERIHDAFLASHKLKSFIGNLSIGSFYEDIRELTEQLRAETGQDYSARLKEMDAKYERIIAAIKEESHG